MTTKSTSAETNVAAGPLIVENYHDYAPPSKTRESVQMLLRYVPPKYLVGLHSIVLSNIEAFSRKERRQKTWGRRRKVRLTRTLGWYSHRTRTSPASIRLNVDKINDEDLSWMRHAPLLCHISLANTLYHEIGHHIHAQHRPEFEGAENVADKWRGRLIRNFVRKRYPYLVPVLWLFNRTLSPIIRKSLRGKVPANDPIFRKPAR